MMTAGLLGGWLAYDGVTDLLGGDGGPSAQGVILRVEASSLTVVDSLTLRTNDGRTLVLKIAPDAARDPREGFVAGHLRSHASLVQQVEIFYREQDGDLLAERLEDR